MRFKFGAEPIKLSLAALFVVACWAYAPIGIHVGLGAYGPSHLALLRFLIASVFLTVVAVIKHVHLPKINDFPFLFILGLFAVTLHHIALNFGQEGIGAGAASVLAQSTPIFTAILARFFLREVVSLLRWACIAGGVTGATIIVIGNRGITSFDYHGLLIIAAAISWSIYFCLQRKCTTKYDMLSVVCCTVWMGTAQLCIYLPGLGKEIIAAPLNVNFAVLLLGIFPSALAYLGWAYVLRHVEVSRASIALYFIPPTAIIMASVILNEKPTASVLVGGAIVITSILTMNLDQSDRRPNNPCPRKNVGRSP